MARDVVLSVENNEGWSTWGNNFVKRHSLSVQHTLVPLPDVDTAKIAVLRAVKEAGPGGRVIVNIGHGAGGGKDSQSDQGVFELAPGGVMKIVGRNVAGGFVDVFYDVNVKGPPSMSDMENDQKNNPSSPRLARWAVYQEIARAFKTVRPREVVLLTCNVGNASEFLRKVANDWGVVIRAYRKRVALTKDQTIIGKVVTRRFFMHLENQSTLGRSAAELIDMEEQIPFLPAQTFLVGPPLGS